MITIQEMRELLDMNKANQIAGIRPPVDVVPCGGRKTGDKFFPNSYKVENGKAPHGSQIHSPIFGSHLPGIEWALKTGYPVNHLAAILEGMS